MFKWKMVLIVCALCSALASQADTTFVAGGDIGGFLRVDESPFVIQGDVYVSDNSFLFIDPGVTVYFDGHYQLEVRPGAEFTAIGTESDSIYFTTDTLANPEGWHTLRIDSAEGQTPIEYCVFENTSEAGEAACFVSDASVAIRNCTFRNNGFNNATLLGDYEYGAALRMTGSVTFEVRNCVFENNRANTGGAVSSWLMDQAEGEYVNCVFRNNVAGRGGAMFISILGQDIDVRHCLFENNSSHDTPTYFMGFGGAIWAEGGGTVESCVFRGNHAETDGGAIYMNMAAIDSIRDCRFEQNTADSTGGAIWVASGGPKWIKRCLFIGNQAEIAGALFVGGYDGYNVLNNTIVNSVSSETSAAIIIYDCFEARFFNNVVAFCSGGTAIHNPYIPFNGRGIRHNSFFGNEGGDFSGYNASVYGQPGDSSDQYANQYLDPMFVDAEGGDFHLLRQSPLIDAGYYYPPAGLRLDPDSTIMDIGAYYFDQTPSEVNVPQSTSAQDYALCANYPNPFNPVTEIEYQIASSMLTSLRVYDVLGREVATLVNEVKSAGNYTVVFDGSGLPSGVYIYRLQAGEFSQSRKMVLLK